MDSPLSAPSASNSAGNSARYSIGIADTSEVPLAADSAVPSTQARSEPSVRASVSASTGLGTAGIGGGERESLSAQISDTASDDGSVASAQSAVTAGNRQPGALYIFTAIS